MDLWDIGRLLLRRWFVFVPLLLVTIAATLQVSNFVKPEYTATGSVLLVPPTGKPAPVPAGKPIPPGNPWSELGQVAMAQAVTIILESQSSRAAVASAGFEPGYKMSIVTRSAIVSVEVTSKSPAKAKGTVQYVLKNVSQEVMLKQKAFADQPNLTITTDTLDGEGTVKPVTTAVRRAQIAIAGMGMLVTIVLTIIADALIKLIRRRRERMIRATVRGAAQPVPPTQIAIKDSKKDRSITTDDTMVLHVISQDTEPANDEPTLPLT